MQTWAVVFLAIGLIAGLVAFTGFGSGVLTFALIAVFFVLAMDGLALLSTRARSRPVVVHRPV